MKHSLLLLGLALFAGCQPGLNRQPKLGPLAHSSYFPDGASARPLPAGVVPYPAGSSPTLPPLEELEHGRKLYRIHCAVCHGLSGEGGIAASRGFAGIPSLLGDHARAQTEKDVSGWIAQGRGRMYGMADRLPPSEIRAISAFVRALQLSQAIPMEELNPAERKELENL